MYCSFCSSISKNPFMRLSFLSRVFCSRIVTPKSPHFRRNATTASEAVPELLLSARWVVPITPSAPSFLDRASIAIDSKGILQCLIFRCIISVFVYLFFNYLGEEERTLVTNRSRVFPYPFHRYFSTPFWRHSSSFPLVF